MVIPNNQYCLYWYVPQLHIHTHTPLLLTSPSTRTAGIQNILLLLIATPALIAATHPSPLTLSDITLALTALALLTFESIADNQQFAFHAWKHGAYDARVHWANARLAWTKDDAARGFCTRGLWSWSRHPNFFAEQSFWVGLGISSPCYFVNTHKQKPTGST